MNIVKVTLPEKCRIICVSDIHAHYAEFARLLRKCDYNNESDYLFILGDILEKGTFFLFKTRAGLNLRAIGENPGTADAAGINVIKYKYLSTCIGAGLAGLGGLYFVMEYSGGTWTDNGFGDRGWLAVALVIFALWKPLNAIWGAFLFGALYILYLYIPGLGRSMQEVFKALPYVVTIIVLVFTSFRKKKEHQPPAALGLPYFREER